MKKKLFALVMSVAILSTSTPAFATECSLQNQNEGIQLTCGTLQTCMFFKQYGYVGYRFNTSGAGVKAIQGALNELSEYPGMRHYYCGKVDSLWGPQTQKALINFQRDQGLSPDGIAGPATWEALHRIYDKICC